MLVKANVCLHAALCGPPFNPILQARVWSSGALRIQDAMESPPLSVHVQLCLEVDASNPDRPVAELNLVTGDSKRLLNPTWQRGEQHKLCINTLQNSFFNLVQINARWFHWN